MTAGDGQRVRTSLVIATYNWTEALAAVLQTVRTQWDPPDEVLIADDGSRAETGDLIARESETFPVPLRHVWHEDAGFRLGAIRNRTMATATGEYLIQLDGDMLLHPGFVRAHRRFAQRGTYAQGSRAMLDAKRTAQCLAEYATGNGRPRFLWQGVRNRVNGIYLPMLARWVGGPRDPLTRTRGANMAFWRDDIVRVNGYNEEISGWGREDSELAARLVNIGVRRRNIKFSAVAWHLHHATRSLDTVDKNHAIFEDTMRMKLTRCARGIDQYLGGEAADGAPSLIASTPPARGRQSN